MKYSIGIPAFKGRFLKECIDSILRQTFTDFELIIVNDSSPDGILNIIKEYNDSRIKYYENESNIGAENVIDNWNKCLNLAQGDFFILMGDDDKLENNYLKEFDKLISNYLELDVFHCRVKIINENSEEIELSNCCPEFETTDNYILNSLEGRSEQFISDFVYRRTTLLNNGGFFKLPLAWCSDYVSAFIACGNKGIAYTSSPIFLYRKNQFNITTTSSLELKRLAILGMENWLTKYLENHKNPSQLLKTTIEKNIKNNKVAFIQQMGGRSKLKGLYDCFVNRNLFEISINDFFNLIYTKYFQTKRSNTLKL